MITKEMIEDFLTISDKEWRYTTEGNIVSREIIFFFIGDKLIDIGINNLDGYQSW